MEKYYSYTTSSFIMFALLSKTFQMSLISMSNSKIDNFV